MCKISNILILGSGNIAWHLARTFSDLEGFNLEVLARSEKNKLIFKQDFKLDIITDWEKLQKTPDIIFVAVSDDAIQIVLKEIPVNNIPIVHLAGSVSLEVFPERFECTGVFYPLQTFTIRQNIDFREIPILVESRNLSLQNRLFELAEKLSSEVKIVNSKEREKIHLVAIFVNNFSNHMFTIGQQLSEKNDFDFRMFHSLMLETSKKAVKNSPILSQTGPAVRNNTKIIDKHLKMLDFHPEFAILYRQISESIIRSNSKL